MPSIFLSYRRDDSEDAAGRIHDKLEDEFGRNSVYIDVANIPHGGDYRRLLISEVSTSSILLVVIGDTWLNARLEDPKDLVRIEIETALFRHIPIIPVLVGSASPPREDDLPETIKPLASLHVAEVRAGANFEDQINRLIQSIKDLRRHDQETEEKRQTPLQQGIFEDTLPTSKREDMIHPQRGPTTPNFFLLLRKKVLVGFLAISAVLISGAVLLVASTLLKLTPGVLIFITIVLLVVGTVVVMVLSVLLEIPISTQLRTDFDAIKNDIAARRIREPEEFSERIVKLLREFITYSFFDVKYAFMYVKAEPYVFSDREIRNTLTETVLDEIERRTKDTEDVFYQDKFQIGNKVYHLYIVPIWFGDQWCGYFGVFTLHKLWKPFQTFLFEFEDDYVDDQLIHVLDIKKHIVQKQFYRDMDAFSNKITRRQYQTLEEYQKDVLSLLLTTTKAMGGVFTTKYSTTPVLLWGDSRGPLREDDLLNLTKRLVPPEPGFYPELRLHGYIYELPIVIEEVQGVIYLIAERSDTFSYFDDTFREIEDIKLDNDLENLAQHLQLVPVRKLPVGK